MMIRNEVQTDYRQVEELTRKAFWNLHSLGCDEHFLVHIMRNHEDFVPELNFVSELDNIIIANIMYTKSKLVDKSGNEKQTLTFGPLSVLPEYQRKGYGKKLLNYSFEKALEFGYDSIIIWGNPENYICSGFKSCKHYNISVGDNVFPTALLVKELRDNAIPNGKWNFVESNVYQVDKELAEEFDNTFEPLVKEYNQSHELFYIYSHSQVL